MENSIFMSIPLRSYETVSDLIGNLIKINNQLNRRQDKRGGVYQWRWVGKRNFSRINLYGFDGGGEH
jgi:hypothetical protein